MCTKKQDKCPAVYLDNYYINTIYSKYLTQDKTNALLKDKRGIMFSRDKSTGILPHVGIQIHDLGVNNDQ